MCETDALSQQSLQWRSCYFRVGQPEHTQHRQHEGLQKTKQQQQQQHQTTTTTDGITSRGHPSAHSSLGLQAGDYCGEKDAQTKEPGTTHRRQVLAALRAAEARLDGEREREREREREDRKERRRRKGEEEKRG